MTNSNEKNYTEYGGRKLPEPMTLNKIKACEEWLGIALDNYNFSPNGDATGEWLVEVNKMERCLGIK